MAQMKELKVGDRVRCFDPNGTDDGVVQKIERDGCITVKHKNDDVCTWHRYQVRRLKPRKRAAEERVEVQVDTDGTFIVRGNARWGKSVLCWSDGLPKPGPARPVHLVEKRPGEVVVSRSDLEKAWAPLKQTHIAFTPERFEVFCKALGLEKP